MASCNWHLRQLYGQNDCKMLNLNLAWLLFCDASVFSEVGYVVIQPLWQKRKASSLVITWLFPEHINLLSLKWLFLNPFIRGLACKARSTGFKRWLENKHKLFELGEHSDTPLSKLRVTKNPKDHCHGKTLSIKNQHKVYAFVPQGLGNPISFFINIFP